MIRGLGSADEAPWGPIFGIRLSLLCSQCDKAPCNLSWRLSHFDSAPAIWVYARLGVALRGDGGADEGHELGVGRQPPLPPVEAQPQLLVIWSEDEAPGPPTAAGHTAVEEPEGTDDRGRCRPVERGMKRRLWGGGGGYRGAAAESACAWDAHSTTSFAMAAASTLERSTLRSVKRNTRRTSANEDSPGSTLSNRGWRPEEVGPLSAKYGAEDAAKP